jgi:hypothetical protein
MIEKNVYSSNIRAPFKPTLIEPPPCPPENHHLRRTAAISVLPHDIFLYAIGIASVSDYKDVPTHNLVFNGNCYA